MRFKSLLCLTLSFLSFQGFAAPGKNQRGTITCKIELTYQYSDGLYVVHGPSIATERYAGYDETTLTEYFGGVVAFHPNGLTTPGFGAPFLFSVNYSIVDRVHGFAEPLKVTLKLGDNRRNSGMPKIAENGVELMVRPGEAFGITTHNPSQEGLNLPRRHGDDVLVAICAKCTRLLD